MRNWMALVMGIGLFSLTLAVGLAVAQPTEQKGKDVTVTGEVVDLFCYLSAGARGPDHKECAEVCAKAGQPIGLVDDKGDVYVLMGSEKHKGAKDMFEKKMAMNVSVTGEMVSKGGVKGIMVKSIKDIGPAPAPAKEK